MNDIFNIEKKYNNVFVINWYYTDKCNQNCKYCPLVFKNQKTYNKIIKYFLLKEFKKRDYYYIFEIEGGEPTLDDSIFELPNFFKDIKNQFILHTNFLNSSSKLKLYKKFSEKNKIIISINLTLYILKIKSNNYILDYLKNIRYLNNNNVEINIIIDTISRKHWEIYLYLIEFFKKNNIKYFSNFAEDFSQVNKLVLANHDNESYFNFAKEIKYCRLKYNYFNYRCYRKFLRVKCFDLFIEDCSHNYQKDIYTFKISDFDKPILCKNNICGIDNFQLTFKKKKVSNDN